MDGEDKQRTNGKEHSYVIIQKILMQNFVA